MNNKRPLREMNNLLGLSESEFKRIKKYQDLDTFDVFNLWFEHSLLAFSAYSKENKDFYEEVIAFNDKVKMVGSLKKRGTGETRLNILETLKKSKKILNISQISEIIKISYPTTLGHINILESAGLIDIIQKSNSRGKEKIVSLVYSSLGDAIIDYMDKSLELNKTFAKKYYDFMKKRNAKKHQITS
jgi:DNA-binding transcriptional ArsR family regulator